MGYLVSRCSFRFRGIPFLILGNFISDFGYFYYTLYTHFSLTISNGSVPRTRHLRLSETTTENSPGKPAGQVKWLFYCPSGSPNRLNRISHIISIFKNTLILNQSCIHHVCCIYPSCNPVLFQMLYKTIQITK